jgi:peptide methionine sulfoxide reductase MsrA
MVTAGGHEDHVPSRGWHGHPQCTDAGDQYRSAVFTLSAAQTQIAADASAISPIAPASSRRNR